MKRLAPLTIILSIAVVLFSCTSSTPEVTTSGYFDTPTIEPHRIPTRFFLTETPLGPSHPIDIWSTSVSQEAYETKQNLDSIDFPIQDLIEVTTRLKSPQEPIPEITRSESWGFELGDQHQFWTFNWQTGEYAQIFARLVYTTPHVYTFVQDDLALDQDEITSLINHFETITYPTNRHYFGKEWNPGVDNDPHLIILFTKGIGSSYQNSIDEFSRLIHPQSNEMEIIYIDAEGSWEGDHCMLAHEFQHVIQWAVDPDEETWMNEGFSVLACELNGVFPGGVEMMLSYLAPRTDIQLNSWSGLADQALADFSASYLFLAYFVDRFGEDALRALAAEQANGLESVDQVLKSLNTDLNADQIFADWVSANYLNNPEIEDGRYAYTTSFPSPYLAEVKLDSSQLPINQQAEVTQYGTDYIALTGEGNYQFDFGGSTQVGLGPRTAYSGSYFWWGGRGTNSDTILTREFNLSNLEKATLSFFTWYDIDQDHDNAFVEVSPDGNEWITLPGQNTAEINPSGFNYGHGYTGASNGWIRQEIDLTPFVGQKIQVRFEYLTDDGPVSHGFFLDDIQISELGYLDDSESESGGWAADGFMRTAGVLPQDWLVQLIIQGEEQTSVKQLVLNPDKTGSWRIDLGADETAVLIVSGITRVTTEKGQYWYKMRSINN
jgi:hypothetical protein